MILINGKQQTMIEVADRGLSYGDGLFESIAYVNNDLHNWDLHWQRLKLGTVRLSIELPDEQLVLANIESLLNLEESQPVKTSGRRKNWVIKVIVTRGQGGRGYLFPDPQHRTLIISAHPWPERSEQEYQEGINAIVCQTCLAQQPELAGIKHLNRLEQILGRNEFRDSSFQEGIMLSCSGNYSESKSSQNSLMIEGTSSNLFFVINNRLCTPIIDTCGVQGTIRLAILRLAPQIGIEVLQDNYNLQQLKDATEVFFTNSVYGILPVASVTTRDALQWHFEERTITKQIAAIINKELKRPYRLN